MIYYKPYMEELEYYPSKVWSLAIHIGMACFIYCSGVSALNTCTDNIKVTLSAGDSPFILALLTTLYPLGCFFGAIIGAPLAVAYGKRNTIIISNLIFIIGSLVCIIPTIFTFCLGRFITGVIGGIFITVPAVFINEISPDQMAGKLGTIVQISCNVGFIASYSLGLVIPTSDLETDPWNYF